MTIWRKKYTLSYRDREPQLLITCNLCPRRSFKDISGRSPGLKAISGRVFPSKKIDSDKNKTGLLYYSCGDSSGLFNNCCQIHLIPYYPLTGLFTVLIKKKKKYPFKTEYYKELFCNNNDICFNIKVMTYYSSPLPCQSQVCELTRRRFRPKDWLWHVEVC